MKTSTRSDRPRTSFSFGLSMLVACALGSTACRETRASLTGATVPAQPGAPLPASTASAKMVSSVRDDWDFTVMSKWHLCEVDDLDDCAKQCNRGHLPSCVRLGNIYGAGTRVEKDLTLAAKLYELPCTYQIGVACSNRASILARDHDFAGAAEYYRRGCNSDDPGGCYQLASLYEEGSGVPADAAQAAALYQKACNGGDARGCSDLGVLYLHANSVAFDEGRAAVLFGRACDGGNAWGCGNLGSAYEAGTGVARDPARAEQLRERACEGGVKAFCASVPVK